MILNRVRERCIDRRNPCMDLSKFIELGFSKAMISFDYQQKNANHNFFRRALNDWEVESFITMLQILRTFGGCTDSTDRLKWKLNSKGAFLVKLVYRLLNQRDL